MKHCKEMSVMKYLFKKSSNLESLLKNNPNLVVKLRSEDQKWSYNPSRTNLTAAETHVIPKHITFFLSLFSVNTNANA